MWPKETVAHKVFTHKHVPPFGGGEPLKAVGMDMSWIFLVRQSFFHEYADAMDGKTWILGGNF
jgi:hypothetical protein